MRIQTIRSKKKHRSGRTVPVIERLENRQLLSVSVNLPTLYFSNAVFNSATPPSAPQLVTLTNTGSGSINFSSAAITGDTTDFLISSAPAANTVIPANGTFQVGVTFTAPSTTSSVTLHTATLTVNTTDSTNPSVPVNLRALALTGYQGGPEPSLTQIFNTLYQQISFTDGYTSLTLPYNLNSANQTVAYTNEVVTQTFVKASPGSITVQPLATFGPAASVPFTGTDWTLGYYTPNVPASTTQVLSVTTAVGSPTGSDAQTVDPIPHPSAGATLNSTGKIVSFDPGSSAFGIYAFFPVDNPVLTAYSQDLLNAATPDGGTYKDRRIRFWPAETTAGTVIPNSYDVGIEEATNNDIQDAVFLISNVKVVPVEVTGVSVSGPTGSPYSIPSGANQLNNLAFNNLDKVSISFSKDVNVTSGDLTLTGNGGAYAIQSFSYNVTNYTATWTLTKTIGADNLHLTLAGVTDTAVTVPTALDGEWTDGVSSFPSGDGNAGGNFTFGFNVLPLQLQGSQVGDGSVQRSSIHSFSVTFNQAVNFSTSSFTLYQATLNSDGTVASYTNDVSADVTAASSDNITWTFTCNSGGPLDRNGAGFFKDGVYQLVLHDASITSQAAGAAALGTGNQIVSFANSEASNSGTGMAQAFHVLYGDINGDAIVNNADLVPFKNAFAPAGGTYNAAFDYNNDGIISNLDLTQLKKRFLESFSY